MRVPIHATSRAARAALRHAHRLLAIRVAAVQAADDAGLQRDYPALLAAIEAALRHEEYILERSGQVDMRDCREDHAMIVCAMHRALPQVEQGNLELGREILGALGDLLALRRLACDAALAAQAARHGKAARRPTAAASQRWWPRRRLLAVLTARAGRTRGKLRAPARPSDDAQSPHPKR